MRVGLLGNRLNEIREPLESVGIECIAVGNLFRKINPSVDVIITDTPGVGILKGWIAKKINSVPLIYRMRGNYWQEVESEGKLSKLREFIASKFIFKLCDGVIPLSYYLKKEFQRRVDFENVAVVRLAKDVGLFKLKRDKESFNIVTLTNFNYFEKIKPIFDYLSIVNEILENFNGKWYVGGKGKYVKIFQETVEKYENVEYCGYVSPPEFLKRGSIMLYFSEFEGGVPNAVLEGMAAALPVIVNDFEPLKEIENVIVIKSKEELVKWLCVLYENPAMRKKFGLKGRMAVEKRYNMKKIGKRYLTVIENLIAIDDKSEKEARI